MSGTITQVCLPYGSRDLRFDLPEASLLAVVSPNDVEPCASPVDEIRRALSSPIGAPALVDAARGAQRVVIVADDMTRLTPVEIILPVLLDELNRAGVRDEQVTVLIALGTHRPMTGEEIRAHFGDEVIRRAQVINNPWQDPAEMVYLETTPNGTPVYLSRAALEADFLIGVGSIVPHHIPGFSGGAKIIQPGITGAATTGATHYLSTRAPRSYLGQVENPVRAEMERIAALAGLKTIFNVVLDRSGRLVQAFYGDPVQAHRAGVSVSKQVYGVLLKEQADIVIAGSHPCDIEFWQAHKSLYPAEIAVKPGGEIILVTPCPEGVAVMHREIFAITGLEPEAIAAQIETGEITDVVSGALALAWAKSRRLAAVSLVSDGIADDEARALGFTPYRSVDEALSAAFRKHGLGAKVTVLTHAPDTLPLLEMP